VTKHAGGSPNTTARVSLPPFFSFFQKQFIAVRDSLLRKNNALAGRRGAHFNPWVGGTVLEEKAGGFWIAAAYTHPILSAAHPSWLVRFFRGRKAGDFCLPMH
jgi:hypothetical protein